MADALRRSACKPCSGISALHADAPHGTIGMVAVTGDGAWSVTTPELPQSFNGAGDLTAAMFLAQLLRDSDIASALASTAAIVYSVLAATVTVGSENPQLARTGRDRSAQPLLSEVNRAVRPQHPRSSIRSQPQPDLSRVRELLSPKTRCWRRGR